MEKLLKQETLDNIDTTINELCIWIKKELKNANCVQTDSILPDVIQGLAKLVN